MQTKKLLNMYEKRISEYRAVIDAQKELLASQDERLKIYAEQCGMYEETIRAWQKRCDELISLTREMLDSTSDGQ